MCECTALNVRSSYSDLHPADCVGRIALVKFNTLKLVFTVEDV